MGLVRAVYFHQANPIELCACCFHIEPATYIHFHWERYFCPKFVCAPLGSNCYPQLNCLGVIQTFTRAEFASACAGRRSKLSTRRTRSDFTLSPRLFLKFLYLMSGVCCQRLIAWKASAARLYRRRTFSLGAKEPWIRSDWININLPEAELQAYGTMIARSLSCQWRFRWIAFRSNIFRRGWYFVFLRRPGKRRRRKEMELGALSTFSHSI